ncbi:MAG: VOC family protein [Alphaproteobacteria bacterium]|nr:VOC family protein [Alphaproteobacteria bacterium]MBU1517190.1 VOC family protein [Alphaproteobacteria bacterium]MBU2093274.1 VOC family protein [Alphaproteobacteria bacterium]MBU2150049.1 VOC family protein [Alphaproteobacteria bacterium]MBU2307806.1 VOC family protein [Alphaproteobacteria bacterium]
MAKVVGIGGVFLRAKDPEALAAWYEAHLGVTGFWEQAAGLTLFQPFKADSDYFPASRQWMINFRVDDLAGLLAQLASASIEAETRAAWDTPETGRFARIHDPEGNPIELWQPPI